MFELGQSIESALQFAMSTDTMHRETGAQRLNLSQTTFCEYQGYAWTQ